MLLLVVALKGNSSQNTSVVHMTDLTDFSLLLKFPRFNQLSQEDIASSISLSASFSAVALF